MKHLLNGQVIEEGVRHVKQVWSDMTGAGGNPGSAHKMALPVEYQPPPVQHPYPVQHTPYPYTQNTPTTLYGPGGNLIVYNPHDTAEQDMADNASEAQRVQWVKEVEISPLIHWMVTALACLGGWLAICLVFGFGGLDSFLLLAAIGGSIPLSRRLYNRKIWAIVNSKHSREIYYTWRTRSEARQKMNARLMWFIPAMLASVGTIFAIIADHLMGAMTTFGPLGVIAWMLFGR